MHSRVKPNRRPTGKWPKAREKKKKKKKTLETC